jgi:FkbM family methyltransferase
MINLIAKSFNTLRHESMGEFLKKVKNKMVYWQEKYTFRPYQITKKIGNKEIKLSIEDLFAKHWYDRPLNLDKWPELLWLEKNSLKEGDIVVDCGANIGFTGIFFAKCVGESGKVIGFEALPSNAQNAEKNIRLNKINNYELRNEAVGSHNGAVEFINYPNGAVGKINGQKTIMVPVVKLDDIFTVEKPTFLKIDVEGYEIEVLKGAIEIHCATFSDRLKSVRELLELIPLDEYQVFLQLTTEGEIMPRHLSDKTPNLISQYDNVHLFAIPVN